MLGSPFRGKGYGVVKDLGPRKRSPDPFVWHSKSSHVSRCFVRRSAKWLGEERAWLCLRGADRAILPGTTN